MRADSLARTEAIHARADRWTTMRTVTPIISAMGITQ
jgi:hypothetical protein